MKLYTIRLAPNPRRVHMFLAEKGVELPRVEIDLANSQNLTPEFLAINPLGRIPVLELDDGTCLAESMAICRYFEETHPEPPLFGVDARDRAVVEMWNRRMEIEILMPIAQCFRNTHPYWEGRIPQIAEFGELCRKTAQERMAWLDGELGKREFVAGDRFTVADITGFVGVGFGRISKIRIADDMASLQRWFDTIAARPSAEA